MFRYIKNLQQGGHRFGGFFDHHHCCHGLARHEDADKSTYEGEWQEGLMHGWGVHRLPTLRYYAGEFVNGFKKGSGVANDPTGWAYAGQWDGDAESGIGVETMGKGAQFIGEFLGGKRVRGVMTYEDGSRVYFPNLGADGVREATRAVSG